MEIIKTDEEINKCLEYSEDKDKLKMVLEGLKVFISEPDYKNYFEDDKEKRFVYKITLTRGKARMSFNFGDSIDNTQKGNKPRIYDLLCCLRCDYFSETSSLDEFCKEYGYDLDSRKAEKIFKAVVKQQEKLKKLFSNEELRAFPD